MQMRLHPAESRVRKLSAEIPALFVAFDLLLWDGKPVHERPIEERRAELERVGGGIALSPVSDDVEQGRAWLQTLQAAGFDGVVAKRLGLPYLPGSRDGVVKVKPHKTADCVVAGLRWKAGGRSTIATLLLGLYADDGHLDYVGSCAVGAKNQAEIAAKVLPLVDESSDRGFSEPNRWGTNGLEEQALKPELVVEVRYDKLEKQPLPARDEADPLPPGQGRGPVHVARGAPAAAAGRPRRRGPALLSLVPCPYGTRPGVRHGSQNRHDFRTKGSQTFHSSAWLSGVRRFRPASVP